MQCGFAYWEDGPPALRSVGETAFVAGLAAEAARRLCTTDVCAGIVGHLDMRLGDAVAPVLEAH
ncbi:MAG: amidohydrolase, partial [Pseudomonadota bacterium]|nr:amidohydrolase [Pseudomonadota bacterium]